MIFSARQHTYAERYYRPMLMPVYLSVRHLSVTRSNALRYFHPNISGMTFPVTWHHQSGDHMIPLVPFPIGALL